MKLDLYSVEDGIKWLSQIFQIREIDWFFLFDFFPIGISGV